MVKRKSLTVNRNFQLSLFALPTIIYFFIFNYLPMVGLILAFKNYRYDLGLFGSPWAGFKNFKFFFASQHAWRILRNTVCYNVVFTVAGIVFGVGVALLLFEVSKRLMVKIYQTSMILPNFLSWIIVGFITYIIFNYSSGVLNQILKGVGMQPIDWYSNSKYWPVILTLVNVWKNIGMGSIIYYAGLMAIDKELFEAAEIDGANKIKQSWYISVPSLIPLIIILVILSIGNFFRGDFGLFYNIPRNIGLLYSTTDVIDTYVYRGLMQVGDIGMTTAVGFFQSFVGLILVLLSNAIVKKINPEHSLF